MVKAYSTLRRRRCRASRGQVRASSRGSGWAEQGRWADDDIAGGFAGFGGARSLGRGLAGVNARRTGCLLPAHDVKVAADGSAPRGRMKREQGAAHVANALAAPATVSGECAEQPLARFRREGRTAPRPASQETCQHGGSISADEMPPAQTSSTLIL